MGHDTLSARWAGGVRDGYPAGVPCWIDTTQPDPQAAAEFYRGLLGWELEDMMPPNSPGQYFVARLHGRDVAAISSIPGGNSTRAKWNTYVWADNTDETAQRVEQARGRVLAAPFDVPGAGRMAECADPSGAGFRIWQAREHRGAQLVNAPGSWNWSNLNTPDAEGAMLFTRRCSAGNLARWTSALARRGWCACQATRTFSRCVIQAFETDTPRQVHRQASPTPSAGCSQFRPTRRRTGV